MNTAQKILVKGCQTEFGLAGCVILYNPDESLKANICNYIPFLDKLYVIDNSTHGNESYFAFFAADPKVEYIKNLTNIGIAEALNKAAQKALSQGYAYMLTMDQDSSFFNVNEFFKVVVSGYQNNYYSQIGIIAASHSDYLLNKSTSEIPGFSRADCVITSGNVLNLNAWEGIGGFNEDLFIDEVDNEFCIRLINSGYVILSTEVIYLRHALGESFPIFNKLKKSIIVLSKHSPLRMYYMTRNNLFIWKKFFFSNPRFVLNRVANLLSLYLNIIRFYPGKISYLKMIFKGFCHFLLSKYGRISQ